MTNIKCYHCKKIHTTVAEVKACSLNGNTKISEVFAAKVEIGTIVETVVPATVKTVSVPAHRTSAAYLALKKIQAPNAGDQFLADIAKLQQVADANPGISIADGIAKAASVEIKKGQDLELGMYQVTDVNGIQSIYKVKFNKAGTFKYAEKLIITDGKWSKSGKPSGKFMYAGSMMNKLTSENKMTEEQAKAFHDATKAKYGVDYGFCCVCGKLLTVKKSIDAGIGPVCQTKF